jgi:hypothetical protein
MVSLCKTLWNAFNRIKHLPSLTWIPKGSFHDDNLPGPPLNLRFAQKRKSLSFLRAALPSESTRRSFFVCVSKTTSTYMNYTVFLKESGNRFEPGACLHLKMIFFKLSMIQSNSCSVFREGILESVPSCCP